RERCRVRAAHAARHDDPSRRARPARADGPARGPHRRGGPRPLRPGNRRPGWGRVMCGIVACRADTPATPLLLEALARLEYRGYDSIGIAVPNDSDRLMSLRSIDRVDGLRRLVDDEIHLGATTGIGHTRWATHGEVSVVNAHP